MAQSSPSSVGEEWEMAEGKRQGIKDGEKGQNMQETRNGKLFVDNNMYVDVFDWDNIQCTLDGKSHFVCCNDVQWMNVNK